MGRGVLDAGEGSAVVGVDAGAPRLQVRVGLGGRQAEHLPQAVVEGDDAAGRVPRPGPQAREAQRPGQQQPRAGGLAVRARSVRRGDQGAPGGAGRGRQHLQPREAGTAHPFAAAPDREPRGAGVARDEFHDGGRAHAREVGSGEAGPRDEQQVALRGDHLQLAVPGPRHGLQQQDARVAGVVHLGDELLGERRDVRALGEAALRPQDGRPRSTGGTAAAGPDRSTPRRTSSTSREGSSATAAAARSRARRARRVADDAGNPLTSRFHPPPCGPTARPSSHNVTDSNAECTTSVPRPASRQVVRSGN